MTDHFIDYAGENEDAWIAYAKDAYTRDEIDLDQFTELIVALLRCQGDPSKLNGCWAESGLPDPRDPRGVIAYRAQGLAAQVELWSDPRLSKEYPV